MNFNYMRLADSYRIKTYTLDLGLIKTSCLYNMQVCEILDQI